MKLHLPLGGVGRFVRRHAKPPGAVPGTLVHTGVQHMEKPRVTVLDYDAEGVHEGGPFDVANPAAGASAGVRWINVDGLHDVDLIGALGSGFGVHPLVLEDIVHVGQRPKYEAYDGYAYLVVSMLNWNAEQREVEMEQVSVLFGTGWVLTFQERIGDVMDPVRERLRTRGGRICSRGADYLAYALIDAIVDRYFTVLDRLSEQTEQLEMAVVEQAEEATVRELHRLKRELLLLRRAAAPVAEMANPLTQGDSPLVTPETRIFWRDVHDHARQITDSVESLRDLTSGLMDLYFSVVSHRANEVMKVLTIMASIFIPLTFVAGIYGMNFAYMPELQVRWAYPVLLLLMATVGVTMLLWFRRRGWF